MPEDRIAASIARQLILVVDDDAGNRRLLSSFLDSQGFAVDTASSGQEALDYLDAHHVDMLVSDVRMPGMSGLDMLRQLRQRDTSLPVLLVTAYADIRDAVEAMRDGAANYLEKPIDFEELMDSVRMALGDAAPRKADVEVDVPVPGHVVAKSPQMRDVLRLLALVAPSGSRILITGESGTGKEVAADLLHAWNSDARGALVKVNCAAIPDNLLESELFGHIKGAFTGAVADRVGRFEEADGGTIFLDEIGEMTPSLQAKLLRVTQDGSFQRVGDGTPRGATARLVAATNKNLEKEVAAGRFREDLFYRLNVVEVYIPPLRERVPDIVPLAGLFATELTSGRPRFSPATISCLELYGWPGNVRELRNAVERAILVARGDIIVPEHLPPRVQQAAAGTTGSPSPTSRSRMAEVERTVVLQTLRENDHNRSETARTLGISRRALLYKLRRFQEEGFSIE
jgi:DNA-binding NtrC family response regulator